MRSPQPAPPPQNVVVHVGAHESHHISVLAGQGETLKLGREVESLARREEVSTGDILLACRDDFQQTAAHIAAKSGQTGMFMFPLSPRHRCAIVDGGEGGLLMLCARCILRGWPSRCPIFNPPTLVNPPLSADH